jgi:hypothetical protein
MGWQWKELLLARVDEARPEIHYTGIFWRQEADGCIDAVLSTRCSNSSRTTSSTPPVCMAMAPQWRQKGRRQQLRKELGLAQGGEVIVEDASDAIVLRTVDQVVARAQALSRKLVAGKAGATVKDFLADRAREAEAE